jgi:DNA-binding NarL/FixJ family response regulator
MKVFLVDDSAIVLEKLAVMVSGIEGVEIDGQATNEHDAIQSIVKLKPDVVILDIRLNGGGNGMNVLKRIKKEMPPPIVIMLTNYPYLQYRNKCKELGADYFFDKVTEIEKIYDTFKQLLKDKS